MNLLSPKELKALEFGALAHKTQFRKYPADIPCIAHPFAVSLILSRAGYSEDVVIAGILHDVVEDTEFTEKDIALKFGKGVADMVMGVTEDKNIEDWRQRKEKYLEHSQAASEEVMAINAADLLANRYEILNGMEDGGDVWPAFGRTPQQVMKMTDKRITILKTKLSGQLIEELAVKNIKESIK